ncbi:hypothetical protein ACH0CG_04250 [Microbacterium sp. 179-I 1D1 NHS]|uniref:hypothetical protein n=1 Tax=Microbacterium sp. 179-I 1D1 NHS TaxID=3374298 RepID=UPI00387A5753
MRRTRTGCSRGRRRVYRWTVTRREARDIAEVLAQQGRVSQDDVDGIRESWFDEPLVDVIGIAEVTALVVRMNSLALS